MRFALAAAFIFGALAHAQEFPARPITIIVGIAPGGIGDVTTRIYADAVSKSLNQKIVVENRPVGGGTVAAVAVQNAAPDGHTLLTITGSAHARSRRCSRSPIIQSMAFRR